MLRDGKVDTRVVKHPLGVVGLHHCGRSSKQAGVECDRFLDVGHTDMRVETLHQAVLSLTFGRAAASSAHDAPPQQFSVRYQIGRASCRAGRWRYVSTSVVVLSY